MNESVDKVKQNYVELSGKIDNETMLLSGGFSLNPNFTTLVDSGIDVLPYLVEDVRNDTEGMWWRFEMISYLSNTALKQSIIFPVESRGKLDLIKSRIVDWWDTSGRESFTAEKLSTVNNVIDI